MTLCSIIFCLPTRCPLCSSPVPFRSFCSYYFGCLFWMFWVVLSSVLLVSSYCLACASYCFACCFVLFCLFLRTVLLLASYCFACCFVLFCVFLRTVLLFASYCFSCSSYLFACFHVMLSILLLTNFFIDPHFVGSYGWAPVSTQTPIPSVTPPIPSKNKNVYSGVSTL